MEVTIPQQLARQQKTGLMSRFDFIRLGYRPDLFAPRRINGAADRFPVSRF
jgi:hypothetical protein